MSEYLNNEERDLLRQHGPGTALTLPIEGLSDARSGEDFLSASESTTKQTRRVIPPILHETEPTNITVKGEEKGISSDDMQLIPAKVKTSVTSSERRAKKEEAEQEHSQKRMLTTKREVKKMEKTEVKSEVKKEEKEEKKEKKEIIEWDSSGSEIVRSELRRFDKKSQSGSYSSGSTVHGSKKSRTQSDNAQEEVFGGPSSYEGSTQPALSESHDSPPVDEERDGKEKDLFTSTEHGSECSKKENGSDVSMAEVRRPDKASRAGYLPRNARSPITMKKRRAKKKKGDPIRGESKGSETPIQYPERALNAYPKRAVYLTRLHGQVKRSPERPLGFRMIGPPQIPPGGKGAMRRGKEKGRPGNEVTLKRDRESGGMSTPSFRIVTSKKAKPTYEEKRGRSRKKNIRPEDSIDSRTVDRIHTQGTRMQPVEPERKAPPILPKGNGKSGGKRDKKKKFIRPSPQAAVQAQKDMEAKHRQVKTEAKRLWFLLGNPVYESPINPEAQFSSEAATLAKRGKRCTTEAVAQGSTRTRKEIRDFERSAQRHGNDQEQVERLREYPTALADYQRILRKLRARR